MDINEVQVYAAALKLSIEAAIKEFIFKTGRQPIIDIVVTEEKTACHTITTVSVKISTELV